MAKFPQLTPDQRRALPFFVGAVILVLIIAVLIWGWMTGAK
jgi:hypothetical protein